MIVKIYTPHPILQEFVINISTVQAVLPDLIKEVVTPYPPTPFQSLMFYCNDPVSMSTNEQKGFEKQAMTVLVGPQTARVNIKVHERLQAIRVDFFPGSLYRLMGLPMYEIRDQGFDAADFFGTAMRIVKEQLKQVENPEEGIPFVEKFLLTKVAHSKELLPFDESVKMLLRSGGGITVEQTASLACLSLKQFERKCKERLGMNPKEYARILRFSKAYRLREARPTISWTEIAHATGYFDQMHLIRDFKVFAGVKPGILEQQLLQTPLRMQRDLPA